jgi:hypothetical protein
MAIVTTAKRADSDVIQHARALTLPPTRLRSWRGSVSSALRFGRTSTPRAR